MSVRPGLSVRLALQLALLAAAVTATAAWVSLVIVESTFERGFVERLDRADGEIERLLSQRREGLRTALAGLEEDLRRREPELLQRLMQENARQRDAAEPLMRRAGLDLLDIVSADGRIVSSGHYPERIDLEAVNWNALPPELPVHRVITLHPSGERPAVVLRHPIEVGRHRLDLVGGLILEERLLRQIPSADAAALVGPWSSVPLVAAREAEFDTGALSGSSAGTAADGWVRRHHPIEREDGEELARIIVALDRSRADAPLRRMRWTFVWVGAVAVAVAGAVGVWISRRLSRPVGDVVRAVNAIAQGKADYTFSGADRDELQELVASFSRLQRSLETQRLRSAAAERVAAWREVARHVAHEVKNPLVPIRLTVQNLLRARSASPERFEAMFAEGMGTILEEVEQLQRLVGEFSEFARMPLPRPEPADLEALLDEVVELYAAEPGLRIHRERAPGLPRILLDRDQIARALKNLVGNAVEAMRDSPGAARELRVGTRLEQEMVHVEIRDRGPGFSTEASRHLFDPYFTTKEGGTGLGMAIAERIVTEHGGVLTVENRVTGGARVILRLPVHPPVRPDARAPREEIPG